MLNRQNVINVTVFRYVDSFICSLKMLSHGFDNNGRHGIRLSSCGLGAL